MSFPDAAYWRRFCRLGIGVSEGAWRVCGRGLRNEAILGFSGLVFWGCEGMAGRWGGVGVRIVSFLGLKAAELLGGVV